MRYLSLLISTWLLLQGLPAAAQESDGMPTNMEDDGMPMDMEGGGMHQRADGRAPVGVMGDHVPMKGAFTLGYQVMRMEMEGNRSGTDDVSDAAVLADYPVAPTSMTMDMHMLTAMYGLSERLSVMAMVPYLDIEMDHVTGMGVRFTTESSGVGDITLSATYAVLTRGNHSLLANAGIGFPTGSIDEKDDTPAGPNQQLPYPMQLGSGTYDLLPGITYRGHTGDYSWGGQLGATLRLGRNDNGYTLGNRFRASAWGARKWANWISTSLRLGVEDTGNIEGADPLLNPMMVPTADPDRRGGTRVDVLAGVNLMGTDGMLKGQRLFFEFGVPVHQDLDGPQLETDWLLTLGAQLRF